MLKRILCAVVLTLTCLAGISCRQQTAKTTTNELTVAAAADLSAAFEEIGKEFEAATGTKVTFSFGSSGLLARQIENGAPMDLLAAANVDYINQLQAKNLIIDDTKKIYARGRITLWLPRSSSLQVSQLADLTRGDVKRIAIANPDHAPYGKAALEALQKAGVFDRVKEKLVYGDNIRQTLQYAQTGNVEVSIVALSLSEQSDGRWVLIPEEFHQPIDQALAVIKTTQNEKSARDFANFITGPQGRQVLAKYGFTFPQ